MSLRTYVVECHRKRSYLIMTPEGTVTREKSRNAAIECVKDFERHYVLGKGISTAIIEWRTVSSPLITKAKPNQER